MSTIKQRVREYAMSHDEILHRAARRSLLSVLVTAGFVTVNHLYPLGAKALLLGALLAGGATALPLIRARRASLGGAPLALPGRAFALAFVAIAAAYAVVDRDRWVAPPNGVVKIGVIVPLTGPYTILGNSFLKAVEMAERDLRGTKYRYQLVRVDVR